MFCSPRPQFPICHTARQPHPHPRTPTRLQSLRATAPVRGPSQDARGRCGVQSACVGAPGSLAAAGWEMAVRSSSRWSAGWVTGAHPASRARQSPAAGAGIHKRRSGQKSVSSEDLRESPQRQKECKEVLSSRTPSVILSQKSEFQEESQLFTHLHLAEMEKVFEDDIHSPAVALIVSLDCSSFLRLLRALILYQWKKTSSAHGFYQKVLLCEP
ncbi:uncharacterized protein [Manis javanica]|uniref:uncharacterized protein isoform X2 n=1 Tax=Manis javanica TaxID=9974 RepID=UPI003C6D9537